MKKIKIIIIHNCIIIKKLYNDFYLVKLIFKLFQKIIFSFILSIFMPDVFINNLNNNNWSKDDIAKFMAVCIFLSTIVSYALQNYYCGPRTHPTFNMPDPEYAHNLNQDPSFKAFLWRVWLAFWFS